MRSRVSLVSIALGSAVLATSQLLFASGEATPPVSLTTKFHLNGDTSDLQGLTNNSAVAPPVNASGTNGTLVINGTGSLNFAPVHTGNGVSFEPGGWQQQHAAFYRFTSPRIGEIFDFNHGEISFYLKSTHTFAERVTLPPRFVFEVCGDGLELFQFSSYIFQGNRLKLRYKIGGYWGEYAVPFGQEDQLFGNGVIMKVRLVWDSSTVRFFLNDVVVDSGAASPLSPNWSNYPIFVFGSSTSYDGGFFASDDVIDEFRILGPATSTPTPPSAPRNLRIVNPGQ